MSEDIEYVVPPNVLNDFELAPDDQPVALLLRHSVRNAIPEGSVGNDIPITDEGFRIARELGGHLGERLAGLHSSPLIRCTQTGRAICESAGVDYEIVDDTMLGDPGAFVDDGERAWETFQERGHEGVVRGLVDGERDLAGWRYGPTAAVRLGEHMLAHSDSTDGLHLFVSHDTFLMVLGALALDGEVTDEHKPWFLDGLYLWRESKGSGIMVRYKERRGILEA